MQFSVRMILGCMTVVAILLVWLNPGFRVVHEEERDGFGHLVVYAKNDRDSEQLLLRVKFTPENTSNGDAEITKTIVAGNSDQGTLGLRSLFDNQTGLWCVYDSKDYNFVFIARPSTPGGKASFWHPGLNVGWMRGLWVKLFREVKNSHPQIPDDRLPVEMRHFAG